MGNCLKTQLKEIVSNNNLLKMDEIDLEVNFSNYEYGFFRIENTASGIITVVGDGAIGLSSSDLTHTTLPFNALENTKVYCKKGNYKIKINNKYSLTRVKGVFDPNGDTFVGSPFNGFDCSSLKYCTNLLEIVAKGNISELSLCQAIQDLQCLPNSNGNLENLQSVNPLSSLNLASSSVIGTTEKIASFNWNTGFQNNIYISNCQNISGDVSYLGRFKMASLNLNNTQIDGNIEDYAAQLTIDGIYIVYTNTGKIKYQGNGIVGYAKITVTGGVPSVEILN